MPDPYDNKAATVQNRRAYDGRRRGRRGGRVRRLLAALLWIPRTLLRGIARIGGSAPSSLRRLVAGAQSRRWRHLIQGLPALLLFAAVAAVATATSLQRDTLIPTYKRVAQSASDAEHLDDALLFWRRLLRLDGGSPETSYAYARDLLRHAAELETRSQETVTRGQAEIESGHVDEGERLVAEGTTGQQHAAAVRYDAWNLLGQVAPANTPGLPEAHLFLAQEMLSNPEKYLVNTDDRTLRNAGVSEMQHHLLVAERGMPNNLDVQQAAFAFYKGMNQMTEAAAALEKLAKSRPHLRYDLTLLYSRMNRRDDAQRNLKLAADYYEDQVRENPRNDLLRIRCAALRLNQGNLDGCVQMLEFGHAQFVGEESPYLQILAQTHVALYDVLTARPETTIEVRLNHLRRALAYRHDFQPALQRMMQMFAGDEESAQAIEGELRRLIAEGKFPAMGHFALGTKAWQKKDVDQALWHLERAVEIDPGLGYAGNNLAWMLSDKEPPELDRALQVIEQVLATAPTVPTYRDTRGHIHLKLQNWQAALADFEFALPRMRDNRQLHLSLSEVYTHLGQEPLAQKHREIASQLLEDEKIRQQTKSGEVSPSQFAGPEPD